MCMHVYIYMCIYIHIYMGVYVCICMCIHVYMNVYVCTYVYVSCIPGFCLFIFYTIECILCDMVNMCLVYIVTLY